MKSCDANLPLFSLRQSCSLLFIIYLSTAGIPRLTLQRSSGLNGYTNSKSLKLVKRQVYQVGFGLFECAVSAERLTSVVTIMPTLPSLPCSPGTGSDSSIIFSWLSPEPRRIFLHPSDEGSSYESLSPIVLPGPLWLRILSSRCLLEVLPAPVNVAPEENAPYDENNRDWVMSGLIPGALTVMTETRASLDAQPRAMERLEIFLTE